MRSKRGGVGDLLSMIISIIVIAFILGSLILVSSPLKKFTEKPAAIKVYGEDKGEEDFFNYTDIEFVSLLEERFHDEKFGRIIK